MKRYLCVGFVAVLLASSIRAEESVKLAPHHSIQNRPVAGTHHSAHTRKQPVDYHDTRWNPHRPPTYYEWKLRRYQQLYPKFYYGFHGRFLSTMGMPSGDVGIRGLPW